jgi:hypothetical protein
MPRPPLPHYRRPVRAVARVYSVQVDEALYRGVLVGGALAILGFWLPIAAWLLRG